MKPSPTNLSDELDRVLIALSRFGVKYPDTIDETWPPIIEAKAAITAAYAEAIKGCVPSKLFDMAETSPEQEAYMQGNNAAIDTFTANLQKEGLLPNNASDEGGAK